MSYGTIIFLNGTSSAGKTTLALALQEIMEEPYQHMALDQFRDGLPARFRGLNSPSGTEGERGLNVVPRKLKDGRVITDVVFGDHGKRLLRGMRRAIRELVVSGNNVVIDDIILGDEFLNDYLQTFDGLNVYFVGVRCPLEVIEQREATRLGRFPGTAESHFELCHAHREYDIEVDTANYTADQCARAIQERVSRGPPSAFSRLRNSHQD